MTSLLIWIYFVDKDISGSAGQGLTDKIKKKCNYRKHEYENDWSLRQTGSSYKTSSCSTDFSIKFEIFIDIKIQINEAFVLGLDH